MIEFTAREKELLHILFSPMSIEKLLELFPDTTDMEWESIYSKLLNRRSKTNHLVLYVDGSSDLENETAGIGGVLYLVKEDGKEEEELYTFSENIGKATNNMAEYSAVIKGLQYAQQLKGDEITIYSDSELIVRQLNLDYKVKNEQLTKLYLKATSLLDEFKSWSIHHIPRSKNRKADVLSSQALKKEKECGS